MEDISLPHDRFTSETHIQALEGLVNRYDHEDAPIHYSKAATNIAETTSSSILKFFSDIGLIEAEKQGVYIPSQPVIDYFTKVGKSRKESIQQIISKLHTYPIYEEVIFHIPEGGVELDELAEYTAGGLDIKKDDMAKIKRAIEIFSEFEAVKIDEDDLVTLPLQEGDDLDLDESESHSTKSDPQKEPKEEGFQDPAEINPDELDLPPAKGDPESLYEMCTKLKEGGKWSTDDIADETQFAKRTVRGILRYGLELGFVKRSDDRYSPTQRGYDLGFESELNDTTKELFIDGVRESDIYLSLLSQCLGHAAKGEGPTAIKSSHCERELRTYFGFTEETERTLKGAINTFLQTVEATGYGNYTMGRRGSETRVEFSMNEIKDLRQSIWSSTTEQTPNKQDGKIESEDTEAESESKGGESDQGRGVLGQISPKKKTNGGPPLRISTVRIQNYRNIQDSGEIRLEPITTFIGKNESGKTSTLEAINSFKEEGEYPDHDICNDIEYESKNDLPIITLTFEITQDIAHDFYEIEDLKEEIPIEYSVTKYADGHIEDETQIDIEPPSPKIVYYNEYDLISDILYFDENNSNAENDTFWNLLKIGELKEKDITETTGREHDQAIENAENEIESRLNKGWSQKKIRVKLSYSDRENCLRLYIQDEIQDEERELTRPSQRSEGFQWFFSFYVNMLAETGENSNGYKILLLDDPAVHLHPSGKRDWLESLEEIAQEEQVLYTSHSPYLIAKQYPSRIRTVEDSPNGTKINADVFDADTGTLEPLRNSLGIDMSSSPFVSEGQILVEGPSEYYILSAVGTYMDEILDREFIDWREISLMPVRGANDVIGKASWLESENLEYTILLDSDEEGRDVKNRIEEHHEHIDNDRVELLSRRPHDDNVVIEDVFDPEFYIDSVNEFYGRANDDFEPIQIEEVQPNKWEIGREEYEGQRIDEILVRELERQDIAEDLKNEDGEIDLAKRPIAEILSEKINSGNVEPDDLNFFNEVLGAVQTNLDP